ncbi:TadE/TadG family type IV pilus assembly protein [Sphingomonas arantia]|uniref:TadE/TadG family type IV pilus assembly protein n=1 Tax=Sphingomonas arantia TaxID=1460676 RepID=A0ABW4TWQ6_9SPHN
MRRRRLRSIAADTRGLALLEFALSLPIVLTLGTLGIEIANYALINMRMSQIALNLADNISRAGEASQLALTRLRESDVNDAFQAARLQGSSYALTTRGRIVLSSLEQNSSLAQYIHWQRCVGTARYNSTFGVQGAVVTNGMGPAKGVKIKAPLDSAVMFVELTYDYRPLFLNNILSGKQLHYTAAFLVRDRRDLSGTGLSNDTTASTCDKYAA